MERESPAERTDPLLPVITAELLDPGSPPALDDRRLAGLLAELDAEDLLPADAPDPARPTSRSVEHLPAPRPAESAPRTASRPVEPAPRSAFRPVEPDPRLEPDPRIEPAPRAAWRPAEPTASRALPLVVDSTVVEEEPGEDGPAPGRYVRRDYRPSELPADAMGLTRLSRVGGSRIGTVLFTAFFVGIFLLILVEVVVSLLRAGT